MEVTSVYKDKKCVVKKNSILQDTVYNKNVFDKKKSIISKYVKMMNCTMNLWVCVVLISHY